MKLKTIKKMILVMGMSSWLFNHTVTLYANDSITINSKITKINNIPVINQFPELPTGCEATALTMLLRYYGVDVTKQQVADSLPKEPVSYYKNGVRYGGDPNKGFVGNPYSKSSYGVFEKPILQVINKYLPERGENLTGKTLDQLLEVVKDGRPVMIWATINMLDVVYQQRWRLDTGEMFSWPGNEHALLLVGYDSTYIYLNDPYTGQEKKYKREVVENRYNTLGKRAVAILPEEKVLKLSVNGRVIEEVDAQEIIYKENKVFIPVSYLTYIMDDVSATYRDRIVYLDIKGREVQLDTRQNKMDIVFNEKKTTELSYEVNKGITRIELNGLTELLPITYSVQDEQLLMDVYKVLEISVDNELIVTEEGKDILLKDEHIFIPVSYISQFIDSFNYEYKDKKVYIQLEGQSYILEREQDYIDIVLEDGSVVPLHYWIEDGITRIELDALIQYMGYEYVIQDSTAFINRYLDEEENEEYEQCI
ncbi:C39 family peptidase [Niameybacter massiliensis]|uniref:C39 family peptidase n=1 Tax=Holtiella tumoricola TaxID=3018743 RepID=A0AA42DK04_9FIRM|nr:C39 family peptidase [Holtiella tumoricola]MDA3730271.1 C39 family peptidase [Holtiella tumoricola]